jgi:hypothetical protein
MVGVPQFDPVAVLEVVEVNPSERGVLLRVVQELDPATVAAWGAQVAAGAVDAPSSLRIFPRVVSSLAELINENGA